MGGMVASWLTLRVCPPCTYFYVRVATETTLASEISVFSRVGEPLLFCPNDAPQTTKLGWGRTQIMAEFSPEIIFLWQAPNRVGVNGPRSHL